MIRYAVLALVCVVSSAAAQHVDELERALQERYRILQAERKRLDSLQTRLDRMTKQIDSEKSRQRVDQDAVNRLMADGVALSQTIRGAQKRMAAAEDENRKIRERLVAAYTAIIDSMQRVEPTLPKHQRGLHRRRTEEWIERRSWIAPSIKLLSFDPKLVQSLQLEGDRTLRSYVERAVTEIETQLTEVRRTRQNFESMITIRKRTLEFADEIRESNPGFLLQPNETPTAGPLLGEALYDKQFALNANAGSVRELLHQLTGPDTRYGSSDVTLDEYARLLRAAEKELSVFYQSLKAKLK
jgi:hypothetical protein